MRKALIYWFAFLAVLLFMTSCKSKAPVVEKTIALDSIVESAKDTVLTVAKDSSIYKAELGTDSNGNVIIKQVTEAKSGRKIDAPKVTIKNNTLQVDCVAEAEELFFSWKEKFIKSYREYQKPIVTNVLTWRQKTEIYIGRTAVVFLLLWLLILVLKFKKILR